MKKILAILTALLLVSCSLNHDEVVVSMKKNTTTKISKEQALKNLYGELNIIDGETRADGTTRKVKSIEPLVGAKTRSGNALDNDLLYIVEFEEGQGSAVLAADTRLDPVIAVLDTDVLTAEDFASDDMDDINAYMASMIDDYASIASFGTLQPLLPAPGHTVTDTIYRVHVHPLLTTKWGRNYPYNGLSVEEADSYTLPTSVVACAQILNYYGGPNVINGQLMNWAIMNYVENKGRLTGMAMAYTSVARLMSALLEMNTGVCDIFNTLGYEAELVRLSDYSLLDTVGLDMIKTSLIDNRPVFMGASVEEMGMNAHYWVVDGCLDYTARSITAVEKMGDVDAGDPIVEYITYETDYDKIHCNFGRDGKCDGYYTYRLFNIGYPNYDIDESVGDKTHFMGGYIDEYSYNYRYNMKLVLVQE